MKAYVLVREQPFYRRDAFVAGLRAVGIQTEVKQPTRLDRETVIVIWNRYSSNHDLATQVERAGGTVIVCENGYIGHGGSTPKFDVHPGGPKPEHYYAVARRFHNDSTLSVLGATPRFPALGVELKPWRTGGDYVLVCPNRSFGVPGRTMPPDWPEQAAARIRKKTGFAVRIRAHPGNDRPKRELAEDLAGARAVVVWTSSCGVHALAAGIPTFCEAPFWILKGAASLTSVESPDLPDRQSHFELMSWSQWTISEISSGDPFRHLLPAAG